MAFQSGLWNNIKLHTALRNEFIHLDDRSLLLKALILDAHSVFRDFFMPVLTLCIDYIPEGSLPCALNELLKVAIH